MDRYPADGGFPELDPVTAETAVGEAPGIPAGVAVPDSVVAKVTRALEAPVEELVARRVINSGEVLAKVLPQLTASLLAANLDDAEIEPVYALTYAAFRRRRSLLLNLEHQVQFGELPWIAALEPLRAHRPDTKRAALGTLRQATMLALTAFPAAILPNPLVRELGALATEAGLSVPLVEEVAADIFMGTFTVKWRLAAERASALLAGSLYARYYDLPDAGTWAAAARPRRKRPRWARRTADDFAAAWAARAREAQLDAGSRVARKGTVLEQSQILTSHNLAVLVDALDLREQIRDVAPELADRILRWVVRRQAMPCPDRHAALQMIKNVAYGWRQAVFFLSFCDREVQEAAIGTLRDRVTEAGLVRFAPAVDGLAHVVAGGAFTGTNRGGPGRRLLGWSVGPHWCLAGELRPAPR